MDLECTNALKNVLKKALQRVSNEKSSQKSAKQSTQKGCLAQEGARKKLFFFQKNA